MTNDHRVCLLTISDLQTATSSVALQGYSQFKHGGHEAIDRYASQLAAHLVTVPQALAQSEIASVVTSPPFAAIPSASHYLAQSLYTKMRTAGLWREHEYVPLRKSPTGMGRDYSALALADRSRSQEQQMALLGDLPAAFVDAGHIIVVNDLRATGRQQHSLTEYLRLSATPERVTWLYIAELSAELGQGSPDVEHLLNIQEMQTDEDFLAFLVQDHWSPTARSMRRLLCLPHELLAVAMTDLPFSTVLELAALAEAEQLCSREELLRLTGREVNESNR